MDRYHIIKAGIVALAIVAAVAGFGTAGAQRNGAAVTNSPYTAAMQMQDAAWRTTQCLARSLVHALFR